MTATDPGRAAVLRERALTDLREAAMDLYGRGRDPLTTLLELGRRAELLRRGGADLVAGIAMAIVRELPGMGSWRPGPAWQRRLAEVDPDALIAGLESPPIEERRRYERAHTLACWLLRHAGAEIAERVVCAAEGVALNIALEGVEDARS